MPEQSKEDFLLLDHEKLAELCEELYISLYWHKAQEDRYLKLALSLLEDREELLAIIYNKKKEVH